MVKEWVGLGRTDFTGDVAVEAGEDDVAVFEEFGDAFKTLERAEFGGHGMAVGISGREAWEWRDGLTLASILRPRGMACLQIALMRRRHGV